MTIEFAHVLMLIVVANASPILFRKLFKEKFNYAIDGGRVFFDGYRILGDGKTWQGLVAALLFTPVFALILSYSFLTGFLVGFYAMLGDSLSSFIKRRLGMHSSSMAPLLDQIPESLLPAIMLRHQFGLDWLSIFILIVIFFILELMLSYLFFKLGVRKHPY